MAEIEAMARRDAVTAAGFEAFFRAEYPDLVRGLFVLTADLGEAEELAQEAMARVYERWQRVGRMASPGGYAYRAAVNIHRNRLRHLAIRARHLLIAGARPSPPEEHSELAAALAGLRIPLREAFLLVEWVGLTAEEAGRVLGIRPSSVRSRVHRARAALRASLEEGGDG